MTAPFRALSAGEAPATEPRLRTLRLTRASSRRWIQPIQPGRLPALSIVWIARLKWSIVREHSLMVSH